MLRRLTLLLACLLGVTMLAQSAARVNRGRQLSPSEMAVSFGGQDPIPHYLACCDESPACSPINPTNACEGRQESGCYLDLTVQYAGERKVCTPTDVQGGGDCTTDISQHLCAKDYLCLWYNGRCFQGTQYGPDGWVPDHCYPPAGCN
ncbi:MAG: hypothetical protein ACP5XB_26745 [Isosphaeraceae bacterium]